jgi:hypothetical protein
LLHASVLARPLQHRKYEVTMNQTVTPTTASAANVVAFVEKLALDAPFWDPARLAVVWKDVERRLLAQLREAEARSGSAHAEAGSVDYERIRNLTWEVTVSIDLGCVHVRPLARLAELLKQQAQYREPRSSQRVDDASQHTGSVC